MAERVELLDSPDWHLQPGDKIVATLVDAIKAEPVFSRIFGSSVYGYKRMDIGVREMPAMRIYNDTGRKEAETWYLNGDVKLEVILPASTRRQDLQRLSDLMTSALIAWFRAQPTFRTVAAKVPGLNQLGWFFSFDKSLAFQPGADSDPCPLTQITVNYRVLLNEWDAYLESDDRTSEEPFRRTLADLERIYVETIAKDDTATTQVTDSSQAQPTEE
jgi:hypothetical protein